MYNAIMHLNASTLNILLPMSDARQMKLLLSIKKQTEQEKDSKWAELETTYAEKLALANNDNEALH